MTVIPTALPTIADGLRAAFGNCAASTWVITSSHGGAPTGFTAISVVSVSMQPPMVSFNLATSASSRAALEAEGRVALHLLAAHQESVARTFAGPREHRFADDGSWDWHEDGLPGLTQYLTRLRGDVVNLYDAGDSLIVTAQVRAIETGSGSPLVHHNARFRALDASQPLHYVLRGA